MLFFQGQENCWLFRDFYKGIPPKSVKLWDENGLSAASVAAL
jgi:hypothetical protein